ncbi:MAG: hypothetical protein ABIN61_02860 [candidate division WOR-3 bacterium]
MKKKVLLLILLCFLTLFPTSFIPKLFPFWKTEFYWLFKKEFFHIAIRFLFYGILGWLISSILCEKKLRFLPFLIILGIATSQELIQMLAGEGPLDLKDYFDLLIDFSSGGIGIILFFLRKA